MKIRIPVALGATAVSAALLLGACGSDHDSMATGSGSMNGSVSTVTTVAIPADADFNATDVGFAQGMIPHHAQAIVMADMALAQSEDQDVITLATAIKAAQAPEIEQLTGWLTTWGQPVPDTGDGPDHDMSDMGSMMMSGMMSDADMTRLGASSGATFDRMWLEMMIQHHQGAIEMAQQEIGAGKYGPAQSLAQSIVTSQQAEIDTMDQLIAAMPA